MKHRMRKHRSTSHLSSAGSPSVSAITPTPQLFLGPLLPGGWRSYFLPRRAGRYWGLSITCPECHERPPKEVTGGRRWRWLTVHLAKHNQVKMEKPEFQRRYE